MPPRTPPMCPAVSVPACYKTTTVSVKQSTKLIDNMTYLVVHSTISVVEEQPAHTEPCGYRDDTVELKGRFGSDARQERDN